MCDSGNMVVGVGLSKPVGVHRIMSQAPEDRHGVVRFNVCPSGLLIYLMCMVTSLQKRVSDLLELELQTVVSLYVDAKN